MNCEKIKREALSTLPFLFACQAENGRLKIATPYLYPNGDYIDFYIPTTRRPHLVETLSSQSTGYANILVSRVVRTWHDLRRVDGRYGYISLVDDSTDVWKETWFDQLAELSKVVVWSEREKLLVVSGTRER